MPDNLAPAVIATSGSIVIETFLKHYIGPKKAREDKDGHETARTELMYDEVFAVAKSFLATASNHTANAIQKFGQTWTPSPPWVAVHRLRIPHPSLALSADYLIRAMGGEEMAFKIAGGTKWWQVRVNPGVEAEWIVMKKQYREATQHDKAQSKAQAAKEGREDSGFLPEMDTMRCMLYIHGGAYYWGSINTHRYVIWRFARKMRGRCFAVNYRKAPQYPFPCAIQDCLAAWLYLVNPPPGAPHRPVDPKNIIIAGDSAGGGLVWSLLQILRDTPGLDLPAGAVLLSPWSDLTHSFPSILQNTKTDVIPPYGFLHKPSSMWPPPPPALTEEMQSRIVSKAKDAVDKLRQKGDHPPSRSQPPIRIVDNTVPSNIIRTSDQDSGVNLKNLLKRNKEYAAQPGHKPASVNPADLFDGLKPDRHEGDRGAASLSQTTQSLDIDILGQRLAIDTQIQLYATNAQLCHPWVSPVLGYLGGLPPLYILAGDCEVLRDEIIYAAHKAANPDEYPLREDVKKLLPSMKGIEQRHGPTNVHLQVFDGVGHDLPLFSMTRPARGAFRAVASFCRYVTPSRHCSSGDSDTPLSPVDSGIDLDIMAATLPDDMSSRAPSSPSVNIPPLQPQPTTPGVLGDGSPAVPYSPSLHIPPVESTSISPNPVLDPLSIASPPALGQRGTNQLALGGPSVTSELLFKSVTELRIEETHPPTRSRNGTQSLNNTPFTKHKTLSQGYLPPKLCPTQEPTGDDAGPRSREPESKARPGTAGYIGIYAGRNPFTDHMIRERVSFDGATRPLEPAADLPALQMPLDQIGVIKEGPALRYIDGQSQWDHKFKRVQRRVQRHRERNLKKSRNYDVDKIVARWQSVARRSLEARRSNNGPGHTRSASSGGRKRSGTGGTGFSSHRRSGSGSSRGHRRSGSSARHRSSQSASSRASSDASSDSDADANAHGPFGDLDTSPMWQVQWALNDEAPPPSAIVSRRDIPEGRHIALMADSLAGETTTVSGLSLWVLFATMFSSSGERERERDERRRDAAGDTLGEAKQLHRRRKGEKEKRDQTEDSRKGKGRARRYSEPPPEAGVAERPALVRTDDQMDGNGVVATYAPPEVRKMKPQQHKSWLSRLGHIFGKD